MGAARLSIGRGWQVGVVSAEVGKKVDRRGDCRGKNGGGGRRETRQATDRHRRPDAECERDSESLALLLIPLDALIESHTCTTKNIQCAADGEIDLAVGELTHAL